MKTTFALILMSLYSIAFASDDECKPAGSTLCSSYIHDSITRDLDKELDARYRELINMYSESKHDLEVRLLIDAQSAWIRYRDKVCDFENQAFGGANSVSYSRCMSRMTGARLQELTEPYE